MPVAVCQICGLRAKRVGNEKRAFMAQFPLDEARCKQWVKITGKEDLAYVPIEKLHQLKHICGKHFRPKDFKKKKTQLRRNAVPCIGITAEPLSDEILIDFPLHLYKETEEDQYLQFNTTNSTKDSCAYIAKEHNYCKDNDTGNRSCSTKPSTSKTASDNFNRKRSCSPNQSGDHSCRSVQEPVNHDIENDIKCNADEENNDSDIHFDETDDNFGNDNDNIDSNPVEGIEDELNTHRMDEIDSLFLSYAGAFRKLSPNIQTKLKLDIAKLFARYEIKNELVKKDKTELKKEKKIKNYSCLPVKETSQQQSFQCLKESVCPVEPSITNSNLASCKTSAAKHVNKRKCLSMKSKESVSQEDETRCEESAPALDSPTEHDVKRKCLRQPLMATISKGDATHDETPAPPLSGLPLIESGGQDDIAPTSGSIDNSASSVIPSQDASHIASMPLLSCSSLEPVPCDVDLTSEYLVGTRLLEDETLKEIDDCGTLEDEMSRDVTS